MKSLSQCVITALQRRFCRLTWAVILLVIALDILWCGIIGMRIDWVGYLDLWLFLAIIASLSIFYSRFRRDPVLALTLQVLAQVLVSAAAGAVFSYVSSTLNLPLHDEALIKADHLFGFDWLRYVGFIHAHPLLTRALTFSYISIKPQIILAFLVLFLTGRLVRLQQMTFALITSALLCIVIAALYPSMGGYVHYNIDLTQFGPLSPAAARLHEHDLLGLRGGSYRMLQHDLKGLISFPSYHTVLALLLTYALWPFQRCRLIIVPLNLLVVASTPVDGGHYLMDVLGGLVIAAATIFLSHRLLLQPVPLPCNNDTSP